jgi:hypothetical protein
MTVPGQSKHPVFIVCYVPDCRTGTKETFANVSVAEINRRLSRCRICRSEISWRRFSICSRL